MSSASSDIGVSLVRTDAQADEVREMAWAFIDWLRGRYPDMHGVIDEYLENQNFRGMLAELLKHFTPPAGECLLATLDGAPAGILMLKPYAAPSVCEMNRMFVRPEARGVGVARALCQRLFERARELGYDAMVLSALDRHDEAIALYRSLGFRDDVRRNDTASGASREVLMRIDLAGA